jgi:hypothetical protein
VIGSALGVLWLAALGAAGIAFLSRAVSWLEPLERLAYGAVLGIVVGSLAVLAIAWRAGLTLAMVLGVGITATLVAVALGLRARRAIPGSGEGWAPGSRGARFAFVVIVLLAVRWALLWSSAWTFDDRGLWAGHTYLWGDWSLHLGDVTSFAFGDNFPPVSPRYAGLPHAYHYLTSITAAAMVRLGMDPLAALPFQSFALSVLVALALLAFARRLSGRWDAAALAVILFFVGGGLGWWWSAAGAFQSHDPVGFLRDHVWDRRLQEAHNLRWFNLYYAYLLPQRSTLYGFPLGLLILTMLHRAVSRRAASAWLAAGSIAGLLPFASLGAMLALLLITPALALLFFDFRWLLFFGIWAAAASAAPPPAGRRARCLPPALAARMDRGEGSLVVVLAQEPGGVHSAPGGGARDPRSGAGPRAALPLGIPAGLRDRESRGVPALGLGQHQSAGVVVSGQLRVGGSVAGSRLGALAGGVGARRVAGGAPVDDAVGAVGRSPPGSWTGPPPLPHA